MNIFIKLLGLMLVFACAAPFFIKKQNGEALITLNSLKVPELSLPKIEALTNKSTVLEGAGKTSKDELEVFKWRDKNGVVHYSDRQGADKKGKLTQIKGITILPSHSEQATSIDKRSNNQALSPATVPIGNISKLIKDANQVESLLQGRKQYQDGVIDSMK